MIFAEQLANVEWATPEADLDDGDMLMDVLVLARITRMSDGKTGLYIQSSAGCDEIVKNGLLHSGMQIIDGAPWEDREDP